MSPTDSNSQNDLLIDLTQLTLSSDCGVISSLSDHRSNTVRNKAGMWSVDNQSYTNPFDIQSVIREVKNSASHKRSRSSQISPKTGRALEVTTSEETVEELTNCCWPGLMP